MKKLRVLLVIMLLSVMSVTFSSCSKGRGSAEIKKAFENKNIERITITNSRFAGRYTIIDQNSMKRFKGYIEDASKADESSGLEPDFIFDFYDGSEKLATFKYIAGLSGDEANLIDEKGNLYRVSRSVEDIFIKRLMKKERQENVPEYYVALIKKILEKNNIKGNSKIVVDIGSDYAVTKSITSVEQRSILNSVDIRGIEVKFPGEEKNPDYLIKIDTGKYSGTSSDAVVSVRDKNGKVTKYEVSGNYKNGSWDFHIKYK